MASRTLRSNSKGTRERPLRSYSVTTKTVKKVSAGRGRPPLKSKEKLLEKSKARETVKEKKVHNENPNIDPTSTDAPVKRKRGRPRNSTLQSNLKKKKPNTEDGIDKVVKKSETKNNTVEADSKENKNIEPPLLRRQPRMASLNAIAKVNAVLESYRTDKSKENVELDKKIEDDKISKQNKTEKQNNKNLLPGQTTASKSTGRKSEKKDVTSIFKKPSRTGNNILSDIVTQDSSNSDDDVDEEVEEEIPTAEIVLPAVMLDQAVQTDVCHSNKEIQTETVIFPKDRSMSFCTCKKTPSVVGFYNKYPTTDYSFGHSIHVKGTVLAHCNSHTLAVPIVKRHRYFDDSNQYTYQGATDKINSILDHCIKRNFSHKSSYPVCTKLLYVASQNKAAVEKQKLAELSACRTGKKESSLDNIVIPTLNVEPISIPNSKLQKLSTNAKKAHTNKIKLQKMKYPLKKKKCNGWQFDGASFEECYSIGKEVITRKYYECVSRNNEVIKIYDAVILKSGLDTPDADFVARISSFWEDDIGQFAGEMMMSVQWYYKPEQTINKGNEVIKGQPMEVFASRHKDDNSVACIIDRCYVVTFSQFCRFKAQNQLLVEKRKTKPAMVPEANKHRSRFIPSPDFDPSLVFFCRFGYDYRSGKLIKSQH